jgi:hypothetical protein
LLGYISSLKCKETFVEPMVGISKEIFISNWLIYECCWGGYKKRSYNKNGVMENKGRGHGRPRRP